LLRFFFDTPLTPELQFSQVVQIGNSL
jgi:hypothetical protein